MGRNCMRKSGREMFSGKRGKAAVLCALGVAACILCALSLPGMTTARESFVAERAETDGSYILNGGGFVTTIHMEKMGGAGMGKETAAKAARLSNSESEPEPAQKPQVELRAKEVTQGEYYDTLMDQVAADKEELIAPAHVMELTASLDGKLLDLSGCEISLQVDPTPALVETAMEEGVAAAGLEEDGGGNGKQPGMIVTVQPLGGEAVTRFFTAEELESGRLSPVDVTYTVPVGAPAMYAVSARAIAENMTVNQLKENKTLTEQWVIEEDTTIDLNGYTITCGEGFTCDKNPYSYEGDGTGGNFDPSIFQVMPGATLTIMDSKGGGKIVTLPGGPGTLITLGVWQPCDNKTGAINIDGGILSGNGKGQVIIAYGNETVVNVSNGTITGGSAWGGGGIYAEGTVNVSGGEITGNHAINGGGGLGGGIYAASGTVNISGNAKITGNDSDGHGGGIYAANGKVVMTGGEISNNKATGSFNMGGGVYAKTMMEMSGGTISGNKSDWRGGGVYVEGTMTMTGGTISGNYAQCESNSNSKESDGGGVWAKMIHMSAGEISGNHANHSGGGVYANGMRMTGGTISDNKVTGDKTRGGGGIYLDAGELVFNNDGVSFNMSVTGGTISGNTSDHAGGGIFVNVGAIAYIRGNDKVVQITGNHANDKKYVDGGDGGQGYAGGGIFVEHEAPNESDNPEAGGQLYLYDALITGNTADHGGGIAGCRNSTITVGSLNGVAVYGNTATNALKRVGILAEPSQDLYGDGGGTVDSVLLGNVQTTWTGKANGTFEGGTLVDTTLSDVTLSYASQEFENFYMTAKIPTDPEKETIRSKATTVIEGNTSGSGGGGVGGNGYIRLGSVAPTLKSLVLRKNVIGPSTEGKFKFTITLLQNDKPLKGKYDYEELVDGKIVEKSLVLSGGDQEKITFELKDGGYIRIKELPVNDGQISYTITEDPAAGYTTSIAVDGVLYENASEASGTITEKGADVLFTNTAKPYALPATGGVSPAVYIGGAILLAAAGGLIYLKRAKRTDG